jgi:hypothetical protein
MCGCSDIFEKDNNNFGRSSAIAISFLNTSIKTTHLPSFSFLFLPPMVGHVLVIDDKREDKHASLQQQLLGPKTRMLFTETAHRTV